MFTQIRGLKALAALLITLLAAPVVATAQDFTTVAERSNYRLTSTYEEAVDYLRRLDDASAWVKLTEYGVSPQGRAMHLLIVSKDGAFTPEAAHQTGKTIILIQNGIHSGEIDGKDACEALVRDMVITKEKEHLLDSVIVLIIPIFNLDGHENRVRYTRPNQLGPENAGFRATAQFFNLNRDYLKADAPEMRAWLANWVRWMPDFLVDDHVTDGSDWQYTVLYSTSCHPNYTAPIVDWTKTFYDPSVTKHVEDAGYKIFPYAFAWRGDMSKGVGTWVAGPRFSHGYTALWNRPGLLVEMHSLKDYSARVLANYEMLVATLEVLNRQGTALQQAIAEADAETEAGLTEWYPLAFRPDGDSVMVDLEGYEYDTVLSEISGGTYIKYHRDRPKTYRVPYFGTYTTRDSVLPPRAYLIPREWIDQIGRLRLHGIRIDTLTQPLTARVERYHLDSVEWAESSYESHFQPTFQTTVRETTMTFPTGTAVVDMRQRAAKVAIHALEPRAHDSFVRWGLWNAIFERKEYIEAYVIDPLAERMLAEDPELRTEFFTRLRTDSEFAASPRARRMFFYERSPFFETTLGWYPVARLMDDLPAVALWEE